MKLEITAKKAVLITAWIMSLILAGTYGNAQDDQFPLRRQIQPTFVTGSDLGFQFQSIQGERAIGYWMIRINGSWIQIGSTPSIRPLGD